MTYPTKNGTWKRRYSVDKMGSVGCEIKRPPLTMKVIRSNLWCLHSKALAVSLSRQHRILGSDFRRITTASFPDS